MKTPPLIPAALLIALLLPWGLGAQESKSSRRRPPLSDQEQFLVDQVRPDTAKGHMRQLTKSPHRAGTLADRRTADYVAAILTAAGFAVAIEEYHVLLSEPRRIEVHLRGPQQEQLDLLEKPRAGVAYRDPEDANAVMAYLGYSASGTVQGPIVYAHYGREEDFEWLEAQGVEIAGSICLIRFGKTFRGLKVLEAEKRKAKGVLLYSDPDDDGYRRGDAIPKGPWRPSWGVERGSLMYISKLVGDPLTPGWPAKKDARRLSREQCTWLPKIPAVPISWGNAARIFAHLSGHNVPKPWQGGCPHTYHTGRGPIQVKLVVSMAEHVRPVWNVIGRLRTKSTSKRYLLIGNHRDSWVHGAIDPNSGTTVSLCAMQALGALVKQGWQPRLEIRFASWDAEEQGLIGSTEHAEEHRRDLQENCLAYFNCDAAVSGGKFKAAATPDLVNVLAYAAARTTAHDKKGRLLTRWAHGGKRPPVGTLGSGSDYTAFLCHLGISCMDFGSGGGHGVYHSIHDNYWAVSKFIDPGFEIHASVARFMAIAVHHFVSARVPPIDVEALAPHLKSSIRTLSGITEQQKERLEQAIESLRTASKGGASEEQMIRMHQAFLDAAGLFGREWYKNLTVAPGLKLGYGAVVLPGITEALAADDQERVEIEVQRLTDAIGRATAILSDD
ncbi:MAG: M28 family peptidase [Planctomycetota bacterium]|jgi:N-acetylated-alpha-linked acidic dipeptidase